MDQQHLRSLLTALHQELVESGSVDEPNRELLAQLADDIHTIAQAEHADATVPYQGLRGRLAAAAAAVEATHPRLGKTMKNVIDTLAMYNL